MIKDMERKLPEGGKKGLSEYPGKPMGVYVHIPMCVKKCLYCDFYSVPLGDLRGGKSGCSGEISQEGRYQLISALCREIKFVSQYYTDNVPEYKAERRRVDTVFFGGGTPSLLTGEEMNLILSSLRDSFYILPECEITAECNPATADVEKLKAYRKAGINRLSIGAQSFDDGVLKTLGRIHDSKAIFDTVSIARKSGFDNVSLDLMFGIPGQTFDLWRETVSCAINLQPEHISMYSLEFMAGTPFDDMRLTGNMKETDPETDRTMYEYALEEFAKAGFIQYEISNLAKDGYQCKHNLKYWDLSEYIGIGPAAHSFMTGKRYSNVADIEKYVTGVDASLRENRKLLSGPPWNWNDFCHQNSLQDSASEFMFTGLRKNQGITFDDFEEVIGSPFKDIFPEASEELKQYVAAGDLVADGRGIRLTPKGMNISNRIMAIFV